MKLYPGPGYLIGIFLSSVFSLATLTMIVLFFSEPSWFSVIFTCGFAWMAFTCVREFVGWFTIPSHQEVQLEGQWLHHAADMKLLKGVTRIRLYLQLTQKRFNFVPAGTDSSGLARIDFRDGTILKIRAGQGPFTSFEAFGPNQGEVDMRDFANKIAVISDISGIAIICAEPKAIIE